MSFLRSGLKALSAVADLLHPPLEGPRLLIYHQINAGLGRQMEVTEDNFRRQLDWLRAKRRVVDLEEALTRWEEPEAESLVVLTFDDGYRDVYSRAYPMLKERGLPFTLYLATESIESRCSLGPSPQADPLTWEQIDEMAASGLVTIGAHTHSHADLRFIRASEVEVELAVCDKLIEQRLGVVPRHFAYPWGYWGAEADVVVRSRYETAVLGAPSWRRGEGDPYLIHRFPVQLSDGMTWFKPRMEGGLLLEEAIRRTIRGNRNL